MYLLIVGADNAVYYWKLRRNNLNLSFPLVLLIVTCSVSTFPHECKVIQKFFWFHILLKLNKESKHFPDSTLRSSGEIDQTNEVILNQEQIQRGDLTSCVWNKNRHSKGKREAEAGRDGPVPQQFEHRFPRDVGARLTDLHVREKSPHRAERLVMRAQLFIVENLGHGVTYSSSVMCLLYKITTWVELKWLLQRI